MPCLRCADQPGGAARRRAVEFVVLDDDSRDATAEIVEAMCRHEPRLRLIRGTGDPPPGFLGKPWACARLAAAADPRATVLVFLDADVVLTPHALTRTVTLLRQARLDFVSPYPRQLAESVAGTAHPATAAVVLADLCPAPAGRAHAAPVARPGQRPVAGGRRPRYRPPAVTRAAGVRDAVLEDLALARALRRHGYAGGMADGTVAVDLPDVRRLAAAARRVQQIAVGRRRRPQARQRRRRSPCSAGSTCGPIRFRYAAGVASRLI